MGSGERLDLVSARAVHLSELGLSYFAIARRLEVDTKTAAKAIGWLPSLQP